MKSKQILSIEQMQHLQELEMDTNNASMCWIKDMEGNQHLSVHDEYCYEAHFLNPVPAYTLQDVLDALPESILKNDIQYWLSICRVSISIWMISYSDDIDLTTNLHHEEYESLIDAAYSMLCWAIENKFVETNKNE